MKNRRRGLSCWTSLALMSASPAFATYMCQGPIEAVALNPSGTVTVVSVASGLNTFYVCQIGSTTNGVTSEVCKAIYSQLLTAKATGQAVQWYFSDALSCTTHPNWDWLTGWYYGPSIVN